MLHKICANIRNPVASIDLLKARLIFETKNIDLPSESLDLPSESLDLLSESLDLLTRNIDLLSESLDLLTRNIDLLSESLDLSVAIAVFAVTNAGFVVIRIEHSTFWEVVDLCASSLLEEIDCQ